MCCLWIYFPCREIWTIRILKWASKSIFVLCFCHYRHVFCVASLLLQTCILFCFPVVTGMRFVFCSGHYSYAFCVMFWSLQASILLCFPVITDKQVCVMFRPLQVCILCYVPVITGVQFSLISSLYRYAFCVMLRSLQACILCCARLLQAYTMCWAPVITGVRSVVLQLIQACIFAHRSRFAQDKLYSAPDAKTKQVTMTRMLGIRQLKCSTSLLKICFHV